MENIDKINNELKKINDLKIPTYRKYVTKSGRNVKFLLKVLKNSKYIELYNMLLELSRK